MNVSMISDTPACVVTLDFSISISDVETAVKDEHEDNTIADSAVDLNTTTTTTTTSTTAEGSKLSEVSQLSV